MSSFVPGIARCAAGRSRYRVELASCWPPRAHLLVHDAIRTLMHQDARDAEVDPDRLSFTPSLHLARRQVTSQATFPPSAAGQSDPACGR
jgi:hypothetical protein